MNKNNKIFLSTFITIGLFFVPALAVYRYASDAMESAQVEVDTKKGLKTLSVLEKKDIAFVENHIDTVRNNLPEHQSVENTINYKSIFEKSIIIGDSLVEGFEVYNHLNSTSVIAKKGASLTSAYENIPTLKNLNPSNIYIAYGMNDLLIYKNDINSFISEYKNLIISVQKELPDCNIYVNSILPVREDAISNKPSFKYVDDYNNALESMCKGLDVKFNDCTSLVKNNDSLYEGDGIHFKSSFYPKWLFKLKNESNL